MSELIVWVIFPVFLNILDTFKEWHNNPLIQMLFDKFLYYKGFFFAMIVLYLRQNNLKYFMPRFRSNLDKNCINFYTAKYEYISAVIMVP